MHIHKRILHTNFKIGDLVRYEFRTISGPVLKVGLVLTSAAALGSNVWKVLGLDGQEYSIHDEYLKPINFKEEK